MTKALQIKDFPDYYVTDTGDVYSRNIEKNPYGRIKKMNPITRQNGYNYVTLRKNKKTFQKLVYRIDQNSYRAGYNNGYSHGKSHAYNNVVKTVFIAGTVLIVGTMIYQLGKDSRWTTTENGVAYRF